VGYLPPWSPCYWLVFGYTGLATGINGELLQLCAAQWTAGRFTVASYVGMRGAGDIATYMQDRATTEAEQAAWAEGGQNRVILHGMVGAATAALGEGNMAQGAAGAAAGQAASQAMQDFLVAKGVDPQSKTFDALMELGSAAVGGLAGGGEGARVAVQGDRFNRQLHAPVIKAIADDLAQKYAADHGVSIDEARGVLLRAAMSEVDGFASRYLHDMDSAETRASAKDFLIRNDAVTPSGWKLGLNASADEVANARMGAAALINDPKAYSYVLQAMNPSGDQAKGKALHDYFQSVSFDERFRDWSNEDAKSFLTFNGRIASSGGSAGLSGGVPLLLAANASRGAVTGSNIAGYVLTSRLGAAATAGTVNAGSQAVADGDIRWSNVGFAAAGGALGVGGGLRWTTSVGAASGFLQTEVNNLIYDENKNSLVESINAGITGATSYVAAGKATSYLLDNSTGGLKPYIAGQAVGSLTSEVASAVKETVMKINAGGTKGNENK